MEGCLLGWMWYMGITDNELWSIVIMSFPKTAIFLDDNVLMHFARNVINFKNDNNICGILGRAQSSVPDMIDCRLLLINKSAENMY